MVEQYSDTGISGSKGRDGRPGLDQMLKDASRRKFDVVMAWAIDRLGRSLIDLLGTIQTLDASGVDLYLDQQAIDTTTPAGKLMFQVTGAFAEFERSMIRQRVHAGLKWVVEQTVEERIRKLLRDGVGINTTAPRFVSAPAQCNASSRRCLVFSATRPREAASAQMKFAAAATQVRILKARAFRAVRQRH